MDKIKNSLKLYYNSFKRSFDFDGIPSEGEYRNFVQITAIIFAVLFLGFITRYDNAVIMINGEITSVRVFPGASLFACYLAVAMFPLAGITARRFNYIGLERKYILTTVNFAFRKLLMLFLFVPLLLFIVSSIIHKSISVLAEGVFLSGQFVIFGSYVLTTSMPAYFSILILVVWLFVLKDMHKLKNRLLKAEIKKNLATTKNAKLPFLKRHKKLCIWLLAYLIIICLLSTVTHIFVATIVATALYGIIFVLLFALPYFVILSVFSYLPLPSLSGYPLFVVIGLVILVLAIIIYGGFFFLRRVQNRYITIFVPLALLCVWFPLRAWKTSFDMITSANYVEQKVESIGDRQLNALTVPLLKAVAAKNPQQNILISAHNIYQGLGMLTNGANGTMLEKLKTILGSDSLEQINAKSREIINHHSSALKFSNKMKFIKKHLDKNFKKAIDDNYSVRFASANDPCSITYTSQVTFASAWDKKFSRSYMGDFYTPQGKISVPMMSDYRNVYIANGSNFRILALPYKSGDIFYIILPDKKEQYNLSFDSEGSAQTYTIDDVLQSLSAEALDIPFEKHQMRIVLPKFELRQNIPLQDILARMGLGDLFVQGKASLNKILSDEAGKDLRCAPKNIHIEDMMQDNFIKVDENGTTAVSIQFIVMNYATGGNIVYPFVVDRPFIFMINNGAFAGIIYNPLEKE